MDPQTSNLLYESAVLMDEWSRVACHTKPEGGMEQWAKDQKLPAAEDCSWYHGTWQYLRLLDMVAVPAWHGAFYAEALGSFLAKKPTAHVLISAAADYGMLATLHSAIKATAATPTITIYDICDTPLRSCQWYADRQMLPITTRRENLITGNVLDAPFDLIVTDEFLSVLKSEYKPLIVKRWKELLKPGGAVVTVAMIGGVTTPELRQGYERRAYHLLERTNGQFPSNGNGNKTNLMARFRAFAAYHTRHMIVDEGELRTLFADYDEFSCKRITTPGECVNPTDSFQIVASV
jgi:hypothetical protein